MTDTDTLPLSERITEKDKDRLWKTVAIAGPDECWPWTASCRSSGHGQVKLFGKNGQCYEAHRIAYIVTYGDITSDIVVRHTCDNPPCCNPKHLVPGSHADNVADRVARGRSARGERHGRAKLNWDIVAIIREKIAAGATNRELATIYQVDPSAIRQIRNNTNWRIPEHV